MEIEVLEEGVQNTEMASACCPAGAASSRG